MIILETVAVDIITQGHCLEFRSKAIINLSLFKVKRRASIVVSSNKVKWRSKRDLTIYLTQIMKKLR